MEPYLHLAGAQLPEGERASIGLEPDAVQPPMCLFVERSLLESDDGLRDVLRGLVDVSRGLGPAVASYDELLLTDPAIRSRVEHASQVAMSSGNDERIAEFLEWWPSALLLPVVARQLCLDVFDFKHSVFSALVARLKKSANTTPREQSLNLARKVEAQRQLNNLRGVEQSLKEVLADVVGDDAFFQRERRIRDNLTSVEKRRDRVPRNVVLLQVCSLHAGCHGVFFGGPPEEFAFSGRSQVQRSGNAVGILTDRNGELGER